MLALAAVSVEPPRRDTNCALLFFLHCRRQKLCEFDRRGEIRAQSQIPALIGERFQTLRAGDASIVHQNVNTAKLFCRRLCQSRGARRLAADRIEPGDVWGECGVAFWENAVSHPGRMRCDILGEYRVTCGENGVERLASGLQPRIRLWRHQDWQESPRVPPRAPPRSVTR